MDCFAALAMTKRGNSIRLSRVPDALQRP